MLGGSFRSRPRPRQLLRSGKDGVSFARSLDDRLLALECAILAASAREAGAPKRVIPGRAESANPESITQPSRTVADRGPGFRARRFAAPRNDEFGDRRACYRLPALTQGGAKMTVNMIM